MHVSLLLEHARVERAAATLELLTRLRWQIACLELILDGVVEQSIDQMQKWSEWLEKLVEQTKLVKVLIGDESKAPSIGIVVIVNAENVIH